MPDIKTNNGTIRIADEVLAIIAGTAALETEGVASEDVDRKGRRNFAKGVKVISGDDRLRIILIIKVLPGYNISQVTQAAQRKVKTAVETMSGLFVTAVDINVI